MSGRSSRRKHFRVVGTVRSVRFDVSRRDPAGFRTGGAPEIWPNGEPHYLDEYVTPSLCVAAAFLDGARSCAALDVLRQEMARLYPDRPLSRRAMRLLARDWRYLAANLALPLAPGKWWEWLRVVAAGGGVETPCRGGRHLGSPEGPPVAAADSR